MMGEKNFTAETTTDREKYRYKRAEAVQTLLGRHVNSSGGQTVMAL